MTSDKCAVIKQVVGMQTLGPRVGTRWGWAMGDWGKGRTELEA